MDSNVITESALKAKITAMVVRVAVATLCNPLGGIPSGELYAQHCDLGLETYQKIIDHLKRCGLITSSNHLLVCVDEKVLAMVRKEAANEDPIATI